MPSKPEQQGDSTVAKQRLRHVFRFLNELNQQRNPPKRKIQEQKWHLSLNGLPKYPTIEFGLRTTGSPPSAEELEASESPSDSDTTNSPVERDIVLRVRRADLTDCPTPPAAIRDWVLSGWKSPSVEQADILLSRNEVNESGETVVVHFDDDPLRSESFTAWQELRREWRANELPARAAYGVYERLSELRGTLQRESEKCDLVVGDGVLSWNDPDKGSVFHPVLLQRVQLEFDPSIPEFRIIDADSDSELYASLLSALTGVDPKHVAESRQELESQILHPLMEEASAYLKALASRLFTNGELISDREPPRESEIPLVGRSPYLFLRDRVQGYSSAIEKVLTTIDDRTDICSGLFNIVGHESPESVAEGREQRDSVSTGFSGTDDILFGKPANPQQLEIATRLSRSDSVLVQGPPGTGKSHTIANLIGHLLAQDKSVLVTSHTTKALRVLRHQLAEELRPLCVSVLDQDTESREQLKDSVQGITQRLSDNNADALKREADQLAEHRQQLLQQLTGLHHQMHNARAAEYRDVVVGGATWTPSEAARFVRASEGQHNWIPGPLTAGAPLPLSVDEVQDLYATNANCTASDTSQIDASLPDLARLWSPTDFQRNVQHISECDVKRFEHHFKSIRQFSKCIFGQLNAIRDDAVSAVTEFRNLEPWQVVAVEAGRQGGGLNAAWKRLISEVKETCRFAADSSQLLIEHPVELNDDDISAQQQLATEIAHRYRSGKRSFRWGSKRKQWKQAIASWKVSATAPSEAEHFEAIAAAAALKHKRELLTKRWKTLLAEHDGPDIDSFGSAPEQTCSQYLGRMNAFLGWWQENVASLQKRLEELTFDWSGFLESQPPIPGVFADMQRIVQAIDGPLPAELAAMISYLHARLATKKLKTFADTLREFGHADIAELRDACHRQDPPAYKNAFNVIEGAIRRRPTARRRQQLLAKLEAHSESGQPLAPQWAAEVRKRVGQHAQAQPPGDPQQAWQWRQILEELQRRANVDVVALAQEAERLNSELLRVTNELIDRKAWAAQHARVNLRQRLALNGWLDTVDLLKGGKVVRAAQLRAEARKQLRDARAAVPVWVMPLSRVVESFDFDSAPFDVLIIDEASQCDATALLAFLLGRSVIIVGDEEQVSPSAVGQVQLEVQKLIDTYLDGVPNAANYDGRQSIYRLARTAFGNSTCLLEHFRCVPDIIRFSNSLAYANRMKPLREQSSSPLTPAVVAHRVATGLREGYVNRDEALTIASMIAAAIESDEYAGQSFGVICMVGSEQAVEIETQLRRHIAPSLLEERRVVCGNAAQFQGDERDVVFLSVVDSPGPDGGPLRLNSRQDAKQRYNVAASRARNQMWVVYSLDPDTDLKASDLRRMLIEHARDPDALDAHVAAVQSRAASPFEKQVLERLIHQRFRVTPQCAVGAYSIDIVVDGDGKRLAVECDGDRYHAIEKIADDMARQAVLERLGWTFHRMRGSEFFRNPDVAMDRLFRRLDEIGIPPELGTILPGDTTRLESEPLETSADGIIRRAAELRAEWQSEGHCDSESLLPELEALLDGNASAPAPRSGVCEQQGSENSGDPTETVATTGQQFLSFQDAVEVADSIPDDTEVELKVSNSGTIAGTAEPASREIDLQETILEVLRMSPQPLKAREIRSRMCEAPFLMSAERRDVNSALYSQLLPQRKVHKVEADGTVRWAFPADR